MATLVSTNIEWLQGAPRCRNEGAVVSVTLVLEPSRVTDRACLAWSAGGLHATTPRINGSSITFCVPRRVFEYRTLMRLELIGLADTEIPVFAWTQIPVLEEAILRAEMVSGRPVLSPPAFPPMRTPSCCDWIQAVI
jgi:hypothetical protein